MAVYTLYLSVFYYPTVITLFPVMLYLLVNNRPMPLVKSSKILYYLMCMVFPFLVIFSSYIPYLQKLLYIPTSIDLSTKIAILNHVYPIIFWILFTLGLFSVIFSKCCGLDTRWTYCDVLLPLAAWAIIYFTSVWATYRIEFYMRSFMALIISGMHFFYDKFSTPLVNTDLNDFFPTYFGNHSFNIEVRHIMSAIIFCLIVISLSPAFINHVNNFSAYMSKDEYKAAIWIRDNTPEDSYILTDPGSGFVIRGLTLRNSSTFFVLPDGRMPANSSTILPNIRNFIHYFFNSKSFDEAKFFLKNFNYKQLYLVTTSRTVVWAQCLAESIWTHPFENQTFSQFEKIIDPRDFQLLHQSPTVRIYLYNQTSSITDRAHILPEVTVSNDTVYLVGVDPDRCVYYSEWNGSWGRSIRLQGFTNNGPAAAVLEDKLHLVIRGMHDDLWHGYVHLANGSFSGWSQVSGDTTSPPALAASDTSLYLVVRGRNDNVYYRSWADGSWTDWGSVPGVTVDGPAAAVLEDKLHLVIKGSSEEFFYGTIDLLTEYWSGWALLTNATTSISKPVAS